jgi:proline racemase
VGRRRSLPDPRREDRPQGRLLLVPRAAHLLSRRTITVVECHAGGEVGKVVVDGVPPPPGATVFEQMQALAADDSLRRFLLREPRGSVAEHANLIVPPTRPDCDAGYIIMEPTEYPPMSGSNTICVTTVLLERGLAAMTEPETMLRLEAPAGLVEVAARCRGGRVESVELVNVASFADRLDARLDVPELGTISVDVAFGGMWYAIADASAVGLAIEPSAARELSDVGELIRAAAREQLPCAHPENPEIAGVSIVQLTEPWQGVGRVTRNAVVVAPGRLDRSATGTGLSARMAALHARGLMRVGDTMTHASAIGSTFDGRIVAETEVGGRPAIVPAIRGSAFITGVTELVVDSSDPFPEGYLLSDTWPGTDLQR